MTINKLDYQEYPPPDREYKDRLFRLVFQKKEDLLSLYNAVNGTDYKNPDELEVNTLNNVLYLSMKNDISFLISGTLSLYEHQSTFNPNMPMRGLLYFSKLYEKYIAANEIDIYTSARKTFPLPQHIVFYNGTRQMPDRSVLRLTDLFQNTAADKTPCLECVSVMININYGHNKELFKKCRRLEEYSIFVHTVRMYLESGLPLEHAITQAVDECIKNSVLSDILTLQKAEVIQMVLETFDQEKHDKALHSEGYSEGYAKGKEDSLQQFIAALLDIYEKHQLPQEEILTALTEKYNLSREEAEKEIQKYHTENPE